MSKTDYKNLEGLLLEAMKRTYPKATEEETIRYRWRVRKVIARQKRREAVGK